MDRRLAELDHHANAVFGKKGELSRFGYSKCSVRDHTLLNNLQRLTVDKEGVSAGINIIFNLHVIHHAARFDIPITSFFIKQANSLGWYKVCRPYPLTAFGSIGWPFLGNKQKYAVLIGLHQKLQRRFDCEGLRAFSQEGDLRQAALLSCRAVTRPGKNSR